MEKRDYNMEFFWKCEDSGRIQLGDHEIQLTTLMPKEDLKGNVIHFYEALILWKDDKDYSDVYYYTPEQSNYHTFVETYNRLCKKANCNPVEWA